MGIHKLLFRDKRKQQFSGSNSVYSISTDNNVSISKGIVMTDWNFTLLLLKWFGLPCLYIYAWIANLDNIKSTILFIAALIMTLTRFFFWIRRAMQSERMRELEIKEKENDIDHAYDEYK